MQPSDRNTFELQSLELSKAMPDELDNITETDNDQSADPLAGSDGGEGGGKLGGILKTLLPVGLVILCGVGGYIASNFNVPAEADAEEGDAQATSAPADKPDKSPRDVTDLTHHELEPIIINLNEPQVTRYLRVVFSLGIPTEDFSEAKATIDKNTHDMKNWLIVYLSDLTLDDVRGAKNINRVRRQIQDSLNNRLWPDGRPLILKVSLKEWIIQ